MSNTLPEDIEDGDIIKKVTGKITKLFDAETKEGQYGTYTIQKGAIEIEGKEYILSLQNCAQPKSARGRVVTLESVKDDKKKTYKGVQFVIEKFHSKKYDKDVTQEVIKVQGSAIITYDGDTPALESKSSSVAANAAKKPERVIEHSEPKTLQQLIDQILFQHILIDATVRKEYEGKDEETIRAYVASIWIEANRQGANRFYVFRDEDGKVSEPEADQDGGNAEQPADEDIPWDNEPKNQFGDWASVQIPDGKLKGTMLAKAGKVWIQKAYDAYKKVGFDKDFQKFVRQAAIDLGIAKEETEEADDIPI